MTLSILHVASEVSPFATTGALAEVSAALPRALCKVPELRVAVVTPRYKSIDPERYALARRLDPLVVTLGARTEKLTIFEGKLVGGLTPVPVYFLDHEVFHRDGLYGENGVDYPDNAFRFALLARGALELAHQLNRWPDVVHAHDWQTGLVPYYAKRQVPAGRRPAATVHTIHNLAFQGLAPASTAEELDIDGDAGVVASGEISLLKLGLAHADWITTLSPRYAREIQTPELGAGLAGFLKERRARLSGILTGIDVELWNPGKDPHLAVTYDASDWTGKAACKAALQREFALPVRAQVPLLAMVSRFNEQKGMALIAEAGDELARMELQIVFHGSGDKRFEESVATLARRYPSKVAVRPGHDEALTHKIHAGADFYLMPSKLEPGGQQQLHALRYGALPIVRAVGGLDDTVIDYDDRTHTGTGFKFSTFDGLTLANTVKRALGVYHHKPELDLLIASAMRMDHGWPTTAARYAELYTKVAAGRRPA